MHEESASLLYEDYHPKHDNSEKGQRSHNELLSEVFHGLLYVQVQRGFNAFFQIEARINLSHGLPP